MAKKKTPARPKKAAKPAPLTKAKTREIVRKRFTLAPAGDSPDAIHVPASYHRYLRAHISLVDQSKAPTLANLAKELGISPVAVWKFQKRHPDILPWIGSFVARGHEHFTALIVRRAGHLAIQGSAQHADIFLKYTSGAYVRAGAPGDPDAPAGGDGRVVVNNTFLVPRPDYAGAAAAALQTPAAPALPSAIPNVTVKR